MRKKLTRKFYTGPTLKVAKELLGKYIVRRIHNHSKSLKKLRQNGFIQLIRSRDPWRISPDGILVGGIIAELKIKDLI